MLTAAYSAIIWSTICSASHHITGLKPCAFRERAYSGRWGI
jgi:hypothetical protein